MSLSCSCDVFQYQTLSILRWWIGQVSVKCFKNVSKLPQWFHWAAIFSRLKMLLFYKCTLTNQTRRAHCNSFYNLGEIWKITIWNICKPCFSDFYISNILLWVQQWPLLYRARIPANYWEGLQANEQINQTWRTYTVRP